MPMNAKFTKKFRTEPGKPLQIIGTIGRSEPSSHNISLPKHSHDNSSPDLGIA